MSVLDGEGNDDRRAARLCATLTTAIYNAARFAGKEVPNEFFQSEEEFLPQIKRTPRPPQPQQSWGEMKSAIGF